MTTHRSSWAASVAALLLALVGSSLGAQAPPTPSGEGPWVVRAWYEDRAQLVALAAVTEPWEVHPEEGWLLVDVDREGLALLARLGMRVEVDEKLTAQLTAPRPGRAEQATGIPGYPCYRTVDETYADAAAIAAARPDLVTWTDIGDSWEKVAPGGLPGDDLLVLRLTSPVPGPKPKLFAMGAIHAREYTTAELLLRFAEGLVAGYGLDAEATWLLDHREIHLLLQANPDGRRRAETGASWRKNVNEAYCGVTSGSRGADLNRNYPFRWGCCNGSSPAECDTTYRGPLAASEPETQAVEAYVRSQFPDRRGPGDDDPAPDDTEGLFFDIHSYSELVLWPWGFTDSPTANAAALQTLGRKLAWFNDYEPQQAIGLYPTDGTTDDFAYGELGLPAYTFELGTSFFQSCSAFESTILPDNLAALRYAARAARRPYLEPAGPDPTEVALSALVVEPGEVVALAATLDDGRFSANGGSEPVQAVASARYTVDAPPWLQPGGTPLAAADGAFDEPFEAVTGTVPTAGLADGRHVVWVVGEDAAGNAGVPGAALLWVLDPATAPRIEGSVRDAVSLAPLAAIVVAGPFSTATDPADGSYSLPVPEGEYTVTASAADHADGITAGVQATAGQVTTADFLLAPVCALWSDDLEDGAPGWTAQTPWAVTTEGAASPTHSWSDSPGGVYANNRDVAITTPSVDLSGASGAVLRFAHVYDLEVGWDFAYVELSVDGGAGWTRLATYNARDQSTWTAVELPLPAAGGAPDVRVRFRLDTDGSIVYDGWHVDDVAIVAGSTACAAAPPLFADGFEGGDTGAWEP